MYAMPHNLYVQAIAGNGASGSESAKRIEHAHCGWSWLSPFSVYPRARGMLTLAYAMVVGVYLGVFTLGCGATWFQYKR